MSVEYCVGCDLVVSRELLGLDYRGGVIATGTVSSMSGFGSDKCLLVFLVWLLKGRIRTDVCTWPASRAGARKLVPVLQDNGVIATRQEVLFDCHREAEKLRS